MNRMRSINEFKEIFQICQDRIGDFNSLARDYIHLCSAIQTLYSGSKLDRCKAVKACFYCLADLVSALPEPYLNFRIAETDWDLTYCLFSLNHQISFYLGENKNQAGLQCIYEHICRIIYIIEKDYPTSTDCGATTGYNMFY